MGKHKDSTKHTDHGHPTTADAEVCIKLYDLRREPLMRASRETLLRWMPKSFADVAAVADFGHSDNPAFRQVISYFEMAYGLAARGAVHPELIVDWCGEGIFLFAKIQPYLAEFREKVSPTAFSNVEWITKNTEAGQARLAMFLARNAPKEDDEAGAKKASTS